MHDDVVLFVVTMKKLLILTTVLTTVRVQQNTHTLAQVCNIQSSSPSIDSTTNLRSNYQESTNNFGSEFDLPNCLRYAKKKHQKKTQMSCTNEKLLACNVLHKPSGGEAIAELVVVYGPYMN